MENPQARSPVSSPARGPRYSEEDLAAHQNAINRALGLSPQPDSPPDTEEEQDELIEIEDTTEEDIQLSEEEQGSEVPGSRSPRPPLELIDLTDSPTTGASASPATRRLQPCSSLSVSTPSQPSGAEVSRVYISFFISVIAPSIRAPAGQHSLWPRLLSAMSPAMCPHSSLSSSVQPAGGGSLTKTFTRSSSEQQET